MKSNREQRAENLHARADWLSSEAIRAGKQAHDMASIIPLGQPIIVGHYSEKGDRAYRARINSKYRKASHLLTKKVTKRTSGTEATTLKS
jgi:hypothetical protein